MTTTKGPTMSDTPEVLRHLATLLDGLPGIPEPLVIVTTSSVMLTFDETDGPEFARDCAVDAILTVTNGVMAEPVDYSYGGHVQDWHGRRLVVESSRTAAVA